MGAIGGALQLVEGLIEFLVRNAHELFERPNFGALPMESGLLVRRLAMAFQILDVAQADLEFLMDVAGHDDHVFQHTLLIKELRKHVLEPLVQFPELGQKLLAAPRSGGFLPGQELPVHDRIEGADFLAETAELL